MTPETPPQMAVTVEQQFERIKSVEAALANGAYYADDDECHPCYPTLVAARQIIEKAWNTRLQAIAEPATGGEPYLGNATTKQLVDELIVRREMDHLHPDYRTTMRGADYEALSDIRINLPGVFSTTPSNPPAPSDGKGA